MVNIIDIIFRIFAGFLLAFFAFVPGYISFFTIVEVFKKPTETEWSTYLVLSIALSLFYFLGLLTFRAFTGKGRREDGGLLPPWSLKLFASSFGVVAILMIFMGLYEGNLLGALIGIGYLSTALIVHSVAKKRQKQFNLKANKMLHRKNYSFSLAFFR